MPAPDPTHGPDPDSHIGCCDPCLYIRGGGNLYIRSLLEHVTGGQPNPVGECCRCIPRAIMFRFTPDDYTANCCYPQSHLVHPELVNTGGWLKAVYECDCFGLTFELTLGRFSSWRDATGYEDPSAYGFDPYDYCDDDPNEPYAIGECAWRLRVLDGASILYYETWPIDDYGTDPYAGSCVLPPEVEYGPISWPPSCDEYSDGGYVTFEIFDRDKLAYPLIDHADIDEYSLIELCPDDCGGSTPDCLSVQDDNVIREYEQIADIGGYPAWQYGTNTIQWDATDACWVMLDGASAELARGGTDSTCPLGIWTPYSDYDAAGDYDVFCVSLCHDPYDDYDETDVRFVCGQCTQACKHVCVSGNWRENGWEFLEFTWLRQLATVGGNQTLQQGWSYLDPVTEETEYLWLVDSNLGCQLETEFTSNDFTAITITNGCSCDLYQQSHTQPWPGDVFWYSVHCGFCTDYGFYCGSCRCVPHRLCLFYSIDGTVTENQELLWDATNKQWGDDASDTFTVHLEANEYDDSCDLVVYYEGSPLYLWIPDNYASQSPTFTREQAVSTYDCQKEIWTAHTDDEFDHPLGLPDKEGVRLTRRLKCRKPYADWLSVDHEGFLDEYGNDGFLFIHANSAQDQDCRVVVCDSFFRTECPNACIDQPKQLHATLSVETDDYAAGYGQKWTIEADLYLVVVYQGVGSPTFYCEYIGTATRECTVAGETVIEAWTIRSQEAGFNFHVVYWINDNGTPVQRQHSKTFTEPLTVSCDPIYGETELEEIGSDPDNQNPALMCTAAEVSDDRPHFAKLIVTE